MKVGIGQGKSFEKLPGRQALAARLLQLGDL